MGVPIKDFLINRRNRALGSILGHAEREIFPKLKDPDLEERFRTLIRDAVNMYHDSVLDLMKAEDSARNDVVIEKLEQLERAVRGAQQASKPLVGSATSNGRPD